MDDETDSGGRKKFLYSGPVSSKSHQQEDDQWSFSNKVNNGSLSQRGLAPVDLDNVWSIRNVGLNSDSKSIRSEPSTFKASSFDKNTSAAFYSRHGGLKVPSGSQLDGTAGTGKNGSGTGWSSSSCSFTQGSRLNAQAQPFQRASDALRDSRQRHKNPSPFDRDVNDF